MLSNSWRSLAWFVTAVLKYLNFSCSFKFPKSLLTSLMFSFFSVKLVMKYYFIWSFLSFKCGPNYLLAPNIAFSIYLWTDQQQQQQHQHKLIHAIAFSFFHVPVYMCYSTCLFICVNCGMVKLAGRNACARTHTQTHTLRLSTLQHENIIITTLTHNY